MKALYLLCFAVCPLMALPAAPLQLPGVDNFHQVDQNVYRGAQPSDEGLRNLAQMGIRTIVDLRHGENHADSEEAAAKALGLNYVNVPMEGRDAPTDEEISRLLAVLNGAERGPVFVHCREGKDRTGTVVACYRIAHDHWSNNQALAEANACGLHTTQGPRRNYILKFNPLTLPPTVL